MCVYDQYYNTHKFQGYQIWFKLWFLLGTSRFSQLVPVVRARPLYNDHAVTPGRILRVLAGFQDPYFTVLRVVYTAYSLLACFSTQIKDLRVMTVILDYALETMFTFTDETCPRTSFSLAEILVHNGTAGAGRMAPPASTSLGSMLG